MVLIKCTVLSNSAGDIRNDLYVTMERGEFEKGDDIDLLKSIFQFIFMIVINHKLVIPLGSGKTTSKNVEVSMCVIGPKGKVIEVKII